MMQRAKFMSRQNADDLENYGGSKIVPSARREAPPERRVRYDFNTRPATLRAERLLALEGRSAVPLAL